MRRGASRGFTLLELVLVLALLGGVIALVATPLGQAIQHYVELEDWSEADAEIGYALERMSRDVRSRGRAVAECEPGSLVVGGTTYALEGGTLQRDGQAIAGHGRTGDVALFECEPVPDTPLYILTLDLVAAQSVTIYVYDRSHR